MTYHTLKQKISPLHSGRVRHKDAQITKHHFLLLRKQSQMCSQEFDMHSQEQFANDFQDVSINDDDFHNRNSSNVSNAEDISNDEDVSTNGDISTNGDVLTNGDISNDEDVSTNGDVLAHENDCDIQDSESNITDEPADFEPHNGSYGSYFGNFTEQMLFLWVMKHMICKLFLYRVFS